jgi:hypothetical protein
MQRRSAERFSDQRATSVQWYKCGMTGSTHLQLIRMKEGKTKNTGNILRIVRRQHINAPEELTLDELKVGLQFARIRKADLRKQSKGLWRVHLRDCLIDAQEKKATQTSGHNQAVVPEGRKQKNVVSYLADGQRPSEPTCVMGTKGSQWGAKGIRCARRRGTGDSVGVLS